MSTAKTDIQYAALPFRLLENGALQVMLITSRQTRRWVIPKGWPITRLEPPEVAAREAFEEAGLIGEVGHKAVVSYHYRKQLGPDKFRRCVVKVYPLRVRRELDEWPEMAERQRQWMSPAEAALRVAEAGLGDFLLTLSGDLHGFFSH